MLSIFLKVIMSGHNDLCVFSQKIQPVLDVSSFHLGTSGLSELLVFGFQDHEGHRNLLSGKGGLIGEQVGGDG